ncbi:MAG: MFS transporter [Acidobacteria bacterium]|nr:MFS transporter [Acidobacteriota bacterium]
MAAAPRSLTAVQLLICGIAALGFAFDLYELVVLSVVVRPALAGMGNLQPGNPNFNLWVALLFYLPALVGGVFGLLGGYLTDLFGRRRVLVWSILIYALSAFCASHANTLLEFLIFRCTTTIGVAVEYPAAIAWLAELFANSKQRESILGYTQGAVGLGGLMATGAYYLAVTYAEHLPVIHGGHEAWRYTLLFGLFPAVPLMLVRPFLPESPTWREKRSEGTLKRPSIAELFGPALKKSTIVTALLVACLYAIAFGVLQQTPRMVPGLPQVHGLAARQTEQAVGGVQFIAEAGTFAGRLLFAVLIVWVASQRRFLRMLLVFGLLVFFPVYSYTATHSLTLLRFGIFLCAVFMNIPMSFMWNYLPRIYPTHLRGTGESFAFNVGGRMLGTLAVVLTTQLANIIPGAGPASRLAHSAAVVVVVVYTIALVASSWLHEPESTRLPE